LPNVEPGGKKIDWWREDTIGRGVGVYLDSLGHGINLEGGVSKNRMIQHNFEKKNQTAEGTYDEQEEGEKSAKKGTLRGRCESGWKLSATSQGRWLLL